MVARLCEFFKQPVQLELGIVCGLVFFALLGIILLWEKAESWKT